jgi:group II intron reverse transcriptase/maturase
MQGTLDMIYERSKNDTVGNVDLYKLILQKENILLAYRNIKANTGSKTKGTDTMTIEDFKVMEVDEFIETTRYKIQNYKADTIRRVYIDKANGVGKRPLGIPTMWDRLIQQMFKQILDPIVEAKFHNHSYGFRTNRDCQHAMARSQFLINKVKLHYVVDVDIKSFFDEVNHHKLLQQLYTIGVKDSRILTIINAMLKAPVVGEGATQRGTPQGGLLSTTLANVVLNELDWWISNQWETIQTQRRYSTKECQNSALKKTNLKEMYVVRYADDIKVFTRTLNEARKIKLAMIDFLDKRLHLQVSEEKSKITNLKRERSAFLGFDIKAIRKRKGYVARTYINKERKKKLRKQLKKGIKQIQKSPTRKNVELYNSTVMGIQNYFQYATNVNIDLSEINYSLIPVMRSRLKINMKYGKPERPSTTYRERYKNNFKTYELQGLHIYPLADIRTKNTQCFTQEISNYTEVGRTKKHKNIGVVIQGTINEMLESIETKYTNLEYYDNRISRYVMQGGRCAITGMILSSKEVHCHHIVQRHLNGDDKYKNLVILHRDIDELLHATEPKMIQRYLETFNLNNKQLVKLNKLRKKCNLPCINR